MKWVEKINRFLWVVMPAALYLSYYPVIALGSNESMNFEWSVALLWLVMFDVFGVAEWWLKRELFLVAKKWATRRWAVLLFPLFVTISVIWSSNKTRGFLTAMVMWAVILAMMIIWERRGKIEEKMRRAWWKVFWGSSLLVCGWCVAQCVMDLMGVPREASLMCLGCTYESFGFPHPNGFAIEPQFMGNLLLAPVIIATSGILTGARPSDVFRANLVKSSCSAGHIVARFLLVLFLTFTLFLTFSRGAIYAFVMALGCLTGAMVVWKKRKAIRGLVKMWGVIILSFVMALNFQGLMAAVSPTDDTYFTGMTKALNHLSLGTIEVRAMSAKYDGYVAESTEIRKQLTRDGLAVWGRDFRTVMMGVGIGGAGEALYKAGLTGSPKEIIQNEYVSLLTETGVVGVLLLMFAIGSVIAWITRLMRMTRGRERECWMKKMFVVVTMVVAYGITLAFFSGMVNALQVYLMPIMVTVMLFSREDYKGFLKKLVS